MFIQTHAAWLQSIGRIQISCNYGAKTIRSHYVHVRSVVSVLKRVWRYMPSYISVVHFLPGRPLSPIPSLTLSNILFYMHSSFPISCTSIPNAPLHPDHSFLKHAHNYYNQLLLIISYTDRHDEPLIIISVQWTRMRRSRVISKHTEKIVSMPVEYEISSKWGYHYLKWARTGFFEIPVATSLRNVL